MNQVRFGYSSYNLGVPLGLGLRSRCIILVTRSAKRLRGFRMAYRSKGSRTAIILCIGAGNSVLVMCILADAVACFAVPNSSWQLNSS